MPVSARQTTTRKEPTSRLKPAFWLGLLALLLGLGYALVRGNTSPPSAASLPEQPSAPAPLPAAPAQPVAAPERAPQAKPPRVEPRAEVPPPDDVVPAGKTPEDEPRASHRHHHKTRERETADRRAVDTKPDSEPTRADEGDDKSTFVTSARMAPPSDPEPAVPPTPRAGTEARAIIHAPRTGDKPEAEPRKAYVTPSGRVILPAPPLSQ
jgi:hypothetical protein